MFTTLLKQRGHLLCNIFYVIEPLFCCFFGSDENRKAGGYTPPLHGVGSLSGFVGSRRIKRLRSANAATRFSISYVAGICRPRFASHSFRKNKDTVLQIRKRPIVNRGLHLFLMASICIN